jgi:transposase
MNLRHGAGVLVKLHHTEMIQHRAGMVTGSGAFPAPPDCHFHLIQLPPCCLHLNPSERLSAVMHQHVTHNRHYPTRKQVATAILKFFRETIPN